MGQITIYLDDELESKLRAATEHRKVSRSRWIADLIRQHLDSAWPAEVREAAGTWTDFPNLEELRGDLNYESREGF
jgi:metal-responsive CopG/Arc/MetJ family transcriptional regulator